MIIIWRYSTWLQLLSLPHGSPWSFPVPLWQVPFMFTFINLKTKDNMYRAEDAREPNCDSIKSTPKYDYRSNAWQNNQPKSPSSFPSTVWELKIYQWCGQPLFCPAKSRLQVKDDSNCRFILKFMSAVGLRVPSSVMITRPLFDVATDYNLLGDSATDAEIEALRWEWTEKTFWSALISCDKLTLKTRLQGSAGLVFHAQSFLLPTCQAWAGIEADLHRGLMQYAIRRANRNPSSRISICLK